MLAEHSHSRQRLPNRGHGLGWRRQIMDHRDAAYTYQVPRHLTEQPLPPGAFLDELPIYDQETIGSCTGNGIAGLVHFDAVKQGILKPEDVPSRLMIYWMERWLEGTLNEDAGAEIRDGIKQVAKYGTCLEDGKNPWPYDISKYKLRPPAACWKDAVKFEAVNYHPVPQNSISIRGCLAEGYPVVFGITCYPELDSDEVANTGILPMPGNGQNPVGGHCIDIWGYDDEGKIAPAPRMYICRNSWGTEWGAQPKGAKQRGYFYIPYEYVHRADLSSDFWTIRLIGK